MVLPQPTTIKKLFPRARRNVALAPFTTFGVGGRAAWYLKVTKPEHLVAVFQKSISLPAGKAGYKFTRRQGGLKPVLLAGGSNVVFPDKKFDGLLIHYLNPRAKILWQGETLTCEAGLPLARLINFAIKHGLAGLEALSGIPGTVGGAIVGNAGAYGQSISDHLTRVQILHVHVRRPTSNMVSNMVWLTKAECQFAYRDSIFKKKDWLVLRAEFKLTKGDQKILQAKAREIIKVRTKKYPLTLCSPGSFFKNVLVKDVPRSALVKIDQSKIIYPVSGQKDDGKIPAGYLLEEVGAKGMKLGGLRVADYHGNLIINTGRATYQDVRRLAAKLKKLVQAQFGIHLEEEVRYML